MKRAVPDPRAVVVATDGSADADFAVDWAAGEARARTSPLLIASAYWPEESAATAAKVAEVSADRVRQRFPDVAVETMVVEGDPREVLIEVQDRAAIVVLGARGLNVLRTVWLGSVSYWAARHLQVPVVVVKPLAGIRESSAKGIAVGVDAGDTGDALRVAFEMAARRGCPVTIAHAWWDLEGSGARWGSVVPGHVDEARLRMLDELVGPIAAAHPDVPVELAIGRGSVVAFLVDLGRCHQALVLGRKTTSPFDRTGLGTVASAVVEHAFGVTVIVPEQSKGDRT